MANVAGTPRPDLSHRPAASEDMDFFELLRRLERDGLRFGRPGGPDREPARLGQRVRLSFATRDIANFTPPGETTPARVDVEVLGLIGPEGVLPLSLTRRMLSRLSDRWFTGGEGASADTTFLDFCNMLQHRMLALYWRAWVEAQPAAQAELGSGGRARAMLDTLAGIGLPGLREANAQTDDPELVLRHATSLAGQVNGPERLTRYLADFLDAPVRLVEFTGDWLDIPQPLQTRVGRAHAGLGTGAVIGARSFQRQTRAELCVGPLDFVRFAALIADRRKLAALRRAICFAAGTDIDYDLRLVVARDEVPKARLGRSQLGRTAWLAPPRRTDAGDFRIRNFTTRRESEAA